MGNCLATPQVADGERRPTRPAAVERVSSNASSAKSPVVGGSRAASAAGNYPQAHHHHSHHHGSPPRGAASSSAQVQVQAPPRPDAVKLHQMKKRIAVAAEAITSAADIEVPVVPKTEFAERLIGGCCLAGCGSGSCKRRLHSLRGVKLGLCDVEVKDISWKAWLCGALECGKGWACRLLGWVGRKVQRRSERNMLKTGAVLGAVLLGGACEEARLSASCSLHRLYPLHRFSLPTRLHLPQNRTGTPAPATSPFPNLCWSQLLSPCFPLATHFSCGSLCCSQGN